LGGDREHSAVGGEAQGRIEVLGRRGRHGGGDGGEERQPKAGTPLVEAARGGGHRKWAVEGLVRATRDASAGKRGRAAAAGAQAPRGSDQSSSLIFAGRSRH